MCEESEECKALADPKTWKNASYASCKCSGHSNAANKNGPYVLAPNLEIVDSVKIPAGLKPGDCEHHAASLLVAADLCSPCRLLTLWTAWRVGRRAPVAMGLRGDCAGVGELR